MECCNANDGRISASSGAIPSRAGLKRIRLELARSEQFPAGSFRHGYEFVAPLDSSRHIDIHQWKKLRDHCRVRRFWADEEQMGRLVHRPGGEEHAFGHSTTIRNPPTTTSPAFGLARTPLYLEST